MNTFEHFPDTTECPVCHTNKDGECVLIPVDGTEDGSIEQAKPVHVECLTGFRMNVNVGVIYKKI